MSQISNTMMLCLILGLISWYYFTRLQDSEKEYNKLHKRFEQVCMENQKAKARLKDLQSYKNDVSKTFKILDNELVLINEHLQKNDQRQRRLHERDQESNQQLREQSQRIRLNPFGSLTNNISLLTPDLLNSLFTNMNSEEPPTLNGNSNEREQSEVNETETERVSERSEVSETERVSEQELEVSERSEQVNEQVNEQLDRDVNWFNNNQMNYQLSNHQDYSQFMIN